MRNISKLNVLIFTFFFVTTHQAVGQDSIVVINASWSKLKIQLQRKADITINLSSLIGRSEKVEKEFIEKIRSTATALRQFISASKDPDSLTVQAAYQGNNNLSQAMAKALPALMDDPKFKAQEFRDLQMQLEGIENRLVFAKRNYNEACIKYQRPGLVFGKTQREKTTQISFDR